MSVLNESLRVFGLGVAPSCVGAETSCCFNCVACCCLMKCVSKSFPIPTPGIWFLLVVCLLANSKPADCVAGYFFQVGPLNCFHAPPAWLWNTTDKQSPELKPTQQNILFSLGISLGAVFHCCSAVWRQSQNSSVSFFLPWKLSSGGVPWPAPLRREEMACTHSVFPEFLLLGWEWWRLALPLNKKLQHRGGLSRCKAVHLEITPCFCVLSLMDAPGLPSREHAQPPTAVSWSDCALTQHCSMTQVGVASSFQWEGNRELTGIQGREKGAEPGQRLWFTPTHVQIECTSIGLGPAHCPVSPQQVSLDVHPNLLECGSQVL